MIKCFYELFQLHSIQKLVILLFLSNFIALSIYLLFRMALLLLLVESQHLHVLPQFWASFILLVHVFLSCLLLRVEFSSDYVAVCVYKLGKFVLNDLGPSIFGSFALDLNKFVHVDGLRKDFLFSIGIFYNGKLISLLIFQNF
jgi:hypothetical protein